jgi:DNA-binding NarL/FixJ family response regulator
MRSILVLALGPGSVVALAADRRQAVEAVRSTGANAAIVDLDMPQDEGIATLVSLRSAHPNLAVIVCTFGSHRTSRAQALEAGADEILTKPVSLSEIRMINQLVAERDAPVGAT